MALTFRIDGDVRFISHHDTLRVFRRAFARAELPIRFTEGFNPHPKLSLPLPRPVGLASEAEVLVAEMEEAIPPSEVLERLSRQMPGGIELAACRALGAKERLSPVTATYRFKPGEPTSELGERMTQVLTAETWIVDRVDRQSGRRRPIDVRPFLIRLELCSEGVEFTLRVGDDGSARPSEIAAALGFHADAVYHRMTRVEVRWR